MSPNDYSLTISPSPTTPSSPSISATALADIYFAAFSADPVSLACFPRTPVSHHWWSSMLADELLDPHSRFLALHDAAGKALAFAKWCLPKPAATASDADDALPAWPADPASDHAVADTFFAGLVAHRRAFAASLQPDVQARGFYYLELIAVDPSAQGMGLGQRLFKWGLDEADRAGLPAYLEAGPKSMSFYAREGFQPVSRVTVQVPGSGEYFNQCMVRWPRGRNGGE